MNNEPFDYNKCIERGGYAITRDGRWVRLLCDDAPGKDPIVGLLDGAALYRWLPSGVRWGLDNKTDLFTPPPEPKRIQGHLNVDADGCTSTIMQTRDEADAVAHEDRIACLYIDTHEGEGLDSATEVPEHIAQSIREDAASAVKLTDADYPEPDRIVAVVPDRNKGNISKGKVYPIKAWEYGYSVIEDDNGMLFSANLEKSWWQPIHANKVYAVTDYEHTQNVTAGKVYEAINPDNRGFWFTGDDGDVHFTLWLYGYGLYYAWTRINGADYA